VVIASLGIVWKRKKLKITLLYDRIVFLLALSDMLKSIAIIIQVTIGQGTWCLFGGALHITLEMFSIWLVPYFALELALHVKSNATPGQPSLLYKYHIPLFVVTFVISLILAILPFMANQLALYDKIDTNWCWIPPTFKWARIFLFDMELYIAILFTIILYVFVIYSTITVHWKSNTPSRLKVPSILKLTLFPLIFIVAWMPFLIYRAFQFNNVSFENDILEIMICLIIPGFGFINFILYCVSRDILSKAFHILDNPEEFSLLIQ